MQPQVATVKLPPVDRNIPKDKKRSLQALELPIQPFDCKGRKSPPAIVPLPSSGDEIAASAVAKEHNRAWIVVRYFNSLVEAIPSWTGFNIMTSENQQIVRYEVGYLPTIDAPATKICLPCSIY